MLGVAVPTRRTSRLPATLGHVSLATALGLRPDLDALLLPEGIVAMFGANESMSDLVQDGVADLLLGIAIDQVDRQLDGLLRVAAQAQGSLPLIEGERPAVQLMKRH